jgi:hypothetical protein
MPFCSLFFLKMLTPLFNLIKVGKGVTAKYLFKQLFLDKEFTDKIIELNTLKQLYDKGEDSTGDSIGEYSNATIFGTVNFKGKIQKGQPYDRVTLKDTGDFYKSFSCKYLSGGDGEIQITANTMKHEVDLLDQWGRDIIGLSEESLSELRGFARIKLKEIALKKLAA